MARREIVFTLTPFEFSCKLRVSSRPPTHSCSVSPPDRLRHLIDDITSDNPTRVGINAFVEEAYRMARAYIRSSRNHAVIEHVLATNPDRDLALDVIADLFERDEWGRFVHIRTYFASVGPDMDLVTAVRRLVLGAASDGLFARYKEADGSLSRIVRNLKRAVGRRPGDLVLRRIRGRHVLVLNSADNERQHSIEAPYELLDPWLCEALRGNVDLDHVLETVALFFRSETSYAARMPLVTLAITIRSVSVRLHGSPSPDGAPPSDPDLKRIVQRACHCVASKKYAFYVGRERISAREYEALCHAVEVRYLAHTELSHGHVASNADAVREFLPDVSDTVYRTQYRNIFEYLYQLTREEIIQELEHSAYGGGVKDLKTG